ncbi:MAG: hypothetical protein DHS20C18_16650 [Saprospiraceae bacterium]|nr:MAG: hypothetical protein DHS20C18_16650 [Saprospiraceae bacterium]
MLDNYEVRNWGNLEVLARQVVEGFIIGLHKSPFHGFSVEFAEHRLYNQGESTRNLDWKVYARTDKLFSKRFEEETNLRCQIVIDGSSSMYYPEPDATKQFNKLRFSALASASLMHLLQKQRDAFGLSIFDEEVQLHTRCKSSTTHYRLMLSHLNQLLQDPTQKKATSAAKALHQIADSIHKRSLVIIFSDMFEQSEQTDELFSALQHLKHNKHEVVLFHVVDQKHEIEFQFENRPYEFIDMESGERVKLQPNQVKDYYLEKMKTFKESLKVKCLQYRIDFVEADINKGFRPILQSYLVKRNRMKI